MQLFSDTIQDRNGNVIPGATVTVTDYPSGTTSTTYATNAPGSSTNPITADSNGQYSFYAIDGSYTITTSKSGITTSTKVITLKDNSALIDASGYGVTADGTTDDTMALQAAITASYGKTLVLPAGTIKVTSGLSITSAIRIVGQGQQETYVQWTSTTLNVISVASASAVHFSDIGFSGPASATAGAVISLAHSGVGVNYFSSIERCDFSGGYDHFKTTSAAAWTVRNCYFSAFVRRAITVTNSNLVDSGDSFIYGNVFANGIAGSVGIYQTSSGGLKISNNKSNGLGAYFYQMQLASGAVTSVLLINNNSIENHTGAALKFDTDGGGAGFSHVVIAGNEMALMPYHIDISTASAFLNDVVISGNAMQLNASGTYAINLGAVQRYNIAGNTITGGGGTPTGILLGASCSNGQIGPNTYVSLTTPINDSSTTRQKNYFTDTTVGTNGIQFPATQVASSDVNMLDDYEENTAATPLALTFATAGDLSVTYTRQVTQYIKVGKLVTVSFNIVTSAFTYTTSSGSLQLTGLPFAIGTITDYNFVCPIGWSGLNLQAGYTSVGAQVVSGGTNLIFYTSGDNVSGTNITTTEAPTGSAIVLRGQVTYIALS